MNTLKEERQKTYPIGTWVRAVNFSGGSIDDNRTVPPGTLGFVQGCDDAGTLSVVWGNGSTLGVLPEDTVEIIDMRNYSIMLRWERREVIDHMIRRGRLHDGYEEAMAA